MHRAWRMREKTFECTSPTIRVSTLLHAVDSISSAQRNRLEKSSIRFIVLLSVAGLRHAHFFILLPISQVRIKSFLFWGAINVLSAQFFDGREGICLIRFLFMSWLVAHSKHNSCSVDKKNQLDVTFCILYLSSNSCSTCFGQQCAHHQELTTAWCYSLVLVCAVAAGRWSSPVGR